MPLCSSCNALLNIPATITVWGSTVVMNGLVGKVRGSGSGISAMTKPILQVGSRGRTVLAGPPWFKIQGCQSRQSLSRRRRFIDFSVHQFSLLVHGRNGLLLWPATREDAPEPRDDSLCFGRGHVDSIAGIPKGFVVLIPGACVGLSKQKASSPAVDTRCHTGLRWFMGFLGPALGEIQGI